MALTVTTDLTNITTAETITGWLAIGAQSPALEPDFFAQGSNSVSRAVSNATKGMIFDNAAGIDFSTGTHLGKMVYIWMRCNTPSLAGTRAAGGITVRFSSNAAGTTDYRQWYVDGSDTIQANDGWKCYVIDPTSPGSLADTGTYSTASVRWFGGAMTASTTAKGQNFGIDRISYGFGTLLVNGTVTTAGSGFKEIADWDWGTIGNRYGIITVKDGIIFVQGRIQLGDSAGTAATTFTSESESLVWQRPTYYDGVSERASVPNERPDGTAYFGITRVGNATGNTDVTIGAKVGTGDTASGRSGGTFVGSRIRTSFNGKSGTVGGTLKVYGTAFQKFWGGIDLTGNTISDEWMGGSFNQSGTVDSGSVKFRNVNFIDQLGGSYKFYEDFINDGVANEALATADPQIDWANAVGGTQLTVPAGVPYVRLDAAAGVRNVVKINSDMVGSDDHYVDAIIRFPTGTSQGTIGVFIRASTTLATENYWYLRLDRPNNQVTLIRCDAGVDTNVVGPTAFTLNADTDYQVHLRGSGTTIEGFVNGTKLSTTSATYQTNRWAGIRGTTNTSQSASAEPRVYRFGCGPTTNVFGAILYTSVATADIVNCTFINNGRATSVAATGTYAYSGHIFSGNLVGVRNNSGGAITINATGDSPETGRENIGAGTTTVNNSVNITITVKDANGNPINLAQAAVYQTSDNSEIMNQDTRTITAGSFVVGVTYTIVSIGTTDFTLIGAASNTVGLAFTATGVGSGTGTASDGVATTTFPYPGSEVPIYIRVRKSSAGSTKYLPFSATGTIPSTGFSLAVTLATDPNA